MPKDIQSRVRLDPTWKPPAGFQKVFKQRPRGALHHISLVDQADGTNGDRVRLHLNEELSEAEKSKFGQLMYARHQELFGCACWGSNSNKLIVRISIRKNKHLADARIEVGKLADQILQEIFSERQKKK
ncbi:MAG: hypothetical protein RLZZ70_219 [Candidatus Parcubacteria bacterium]|jgi:hypothetical protein